MKNFEEIYAGLNQAQKKAVDTTEGPVMVIAGPGTGKTQILGARIAKILEEGLSPAQNILCLTYTDAGTVAMRNRLVSMIGPLAYQVNIFTYHGFCNKVIQENYTYFGVNELEPIGDLEEILVFRKLIDGFDANHPLKKWKGNIYEELKRMKQLYETMKKENYTVEDILKACEEEWAFELTNPKNLYSRKTTDKATGKVNMPGDVKQSEINKVKERHEKIKAAAAEFPKYLELMDAYKRYTYDDMIQWVIKAFKEHPDLLDRYQTNYNYILVDEFQDTNGSQNVILDLLTSYWGSEANIFVVGDDDQSIFRFQGANIENISNFYYKFLQPYSKTEQQDRIIVLTENYRSSQKILQAAKLLIENNQERLTKQFPQLQLNKGIIAKGPQADYEKEIEIIRYDATIAETIDIGNRIITLVERGVAPDEIAVIYREHKQSIDLMRYLKNKNIGVKTKSSEDVLDRVLSNRIIEILMYLDEETISGFSRQDLLMRILHLPFFELSPPVIATLYYRFRKEKKENTPSFVAFVLQQELELNQDEQKIKAVVQLLQQWMSDKEMLTLQDLFDRIINQSGMLAWVLKQDDSTIMLEELNTLFSFIKSETHRNPTMYIKEFVEILDVMKAESVKIPWVNTNFIKQGVNFITAHSSKGLEFEYVFVIGCDKTKWAAAKKANGAFSYKLPAQLVHKVEDENFEEDRRLLFVAMTRAKKELVLSYAVSTDEGKELNACLFISELIQFDAYKINGSKINEDEKNQYLATILLELKKDNPSLVKEAYIDEILENYSLSVTHLDTYLKCPLTFYYKNLLRLPSAKSYQMAFGDVVHKTLQHMFERMKAHEKQFPYTEEMLQELERQMMRNRENFTEKQFSDMLHYGKKVLQEYYENYVPQWNKNALTEESKKVFWNNYSLNGKMDKIEINNDQITIVDYKTGKPENVKKYKSDIRPKTPEELEEGKKVDHYDLVGGDYWRQAVFYKILIDNDPNKQWSVRETKFEFIEKDDKDKFFNIIIQVTPEDERLVKEQIEFAMKGILNKQFDGCGKEDCEWCSFVNNRLVPKKKW